MNISSFTITTRSSRSAIQVFHISDFVLEHATIRTAIPDFSGLCVSLTGELSCKLPSVEIHLKAGEYQILNIVNSPATILVPPGAHKLLAIDIPYEFIQPFVQKFPQADQHRIALLQRATYASPDPPLGLPRPIHDAADLLVRLGNYSNKNDHEALYQLVQILLFQVFSKDPSPQKHPISKRPISAPIQNAHHLLTNNYRTTWTLDQLADHVAINKKTLTEKFRRAYGITPIKYLQTTRLKAAQNLITTTSMTIELIAKRVGYKYIGDFTRAFTKYFGYAPRAEKQNVFSKNDSEKTLPNS